MEPPEYNGSLWILKSESTACHYTPLPKSEDMMGKPKPQIRSVCHWLKCSSGKVFKNEEEGVLAAGLPLVWSHTPN